jgi:hypothetical protein
MRLQSFLVVVAVVVALSFGSVFHSAIPHSHDGNEAAWKVIHAALVHDKKVVAAVAVTTLIAVAVPQIAHIVPISKKVVGSSEEYVYKGIAKHRRFG